MAMTQTRPAPTARRVTVAMWVVCLLISAGALAVRWHIVNARCQTLDASVGWEGDWRASPVAMLPWAMLDRQRTPVCVRSPRVW
jgi:hypothetical protein